jgi:3-oxoacid CoA-transferase subunit A
MSKVRASAAEAVAAVARDGMTVAVGGFGLSGIPSTLIMALRDSGVRDLTVVSNNMGVDGKGLGLLLESRQVRKVLSSYVGENRLFAQRYLEVEFVPQGTLAERLRAGGAGIPAFYTPTGVGTPIAEGKPEAEFEGIRAILELGVVADLALVRAHRADREGNLRYRLAARNFNPLVATCGRLTIAEADEILPEGAFLEPDDIHTPGIYVQQLVQADPTDKDIEQHTVRPREA